MELNLFDWIILGCYFIFLFALGIYFSRRTKSAEQYFLASRNSKWPAIGLSIFAANISSEHLIGLAGSGAAVGLVMGAYEWVAVFCLFMLGWVFLPYYLKSKVYTMPEFLERRYNASCRWYLSCISIVAYIFTKISVALFAGGILLKYIMGWDFMTSALILVCVTGIYTILGGLSAVIIADMVQSIILIVGSLLLVIIGMYKVGGFSELINALPSEHFDMIRSVSDPNFPWLGMTLGIFILGIWYWSTDQFIVQKALSAKNLNQAQTGINLVAFLKIFPVVLFILPGMIAMALWPTELAANPDNAYPLLLTRLMPKGLAGLMLAALLSALISSLSSVFNATSTLITFDIFKKIRPESNDKQLVLAGRIFTIVIVLVGLAWIPIIQNMNTQIYQYMQSVQSYISPPIAAVFLLGVFWKRATARSAIFTLIFGGALGVFRFACDVLVKNCGIDNSFVLLITSIPFLHICIIIFALCVISMVAVTLCDKSDQQSHGNNNELSYCYSEKTLKSKWQAINIAISVFIGLTVMVLWSIMA